MFVLHHTFPGHEVQGIDTLKEYMGDYIGSIAVSLKRGGDEGPVLEDKNFLIEA